MSTDSIIQGYERDISALKSKLEKNGDDQATVESEITKLESNKKEIEAEILGLRRKATLLATEKAKLTRDQGEKEGKIADRMEALEKASKEKVK